MTQLVEPAHGLKGICRNMGIKSIANLCADLEQHGRNQVTVDNASLSHKLVYVSQEVEKELIQKIEK